MGFPVRSWTELLLLMKVSRSDPRPSATYVGSLAVGLVMGVLGIIVCLDLVSLPRHISEMNR